MESHHGDNRRLSDRRDLLSSRLPKVQPEGNFNANLKSSSTIYNEVHRSVCTSKQMNEGKTTNERTNEQASKQTDVVYISSSERTGHHKFMMLSGADLEFRIRWSAAHLHSLPLLIDILNALNK